MNPFRAQKHLCHSPGAPNKRPLGSCHLRKTLASVAVALFGSVGMHAYGTVGATVPFTTFEGEAGSAGGGAAVVSLVTSPTNNLSSPVLEASGRAYMQLSQTGQSVTWTNTTSTSFTAMNVRICIPDSPTGTGTTATLDFYVNGVFRQAIPLSSVQTWDYTGGSQNPAVGGAYDFYEESHVFITGSAIAPGSTFKLVKNATNTAAFYYIDCVDMEAPPAPLSQPANSLSIIDYGAVPNSSATDNTTAIQNCINAAKAAGKTVWIPSGTFYLNQPNCVAITGGTMQGAGMWYSMLYHNCPPPNSYKIINADSSTLTDFAMDANGTSRNINTGGGIVMTGSNFLIDHVWQEHTLYLVWAGGATNGTVTNCRSTHSWGDGQNFNTGCSNIWAENNYIRGSIDDSLTIDSSLSGGAPQETNFTFINNTAIASRCHDLAVYGPNGALVQNNLLTDGLEGSMSVSPFGAESYGPNNITVIGNTILRGGAIMGSGTFGAIVVSGYISGTAAYPSTQVWIGNNTIKDSLFSGIQISSIVDNVTFQANTISNPAQSAFQIDSNAFGSAVMLSNTISRIRTGQTAFGYANTNPIVASNYNAVTGSISIQGSTEGGTCIGNIMNGSTAEYDNIDLTGVTGFVARVTSGYSSGGTINVHTGSPTGPLIGSCRVPCTGGWQTWVDVNCPVSSATGTNNVYLVFTGIGGGLMNMEWFAFTTWTWNYSDTTPVIASNYKAIVPAQGGISIQGSTEGGTCIGNICDGYSAEYDNIDLTSITAFTARVASGYSSGGIINIHTGSPTGPVIGTCTVPYTEGWQTWTDVNCPVSGATGTNNVYLVFTGNGGGLMNVEWFTFTSIADKIMAYEYDSEYPTTGGPVYHDTYVGSIHSGAYLVYNNVNLNGVTSFAASSASPIASGFTMQVRLDSPTGTVLGTCSAANTGDWYNYLTQTCALSGASGTHNIYLVFAGGGGINLQWIAFH